MKRLLGWFESRLNLRETVGPMLLHPIPRGAAGPMGWWYVFGSASMTLLMIQVLTGIGLALVYVPSTSEAYASLVYLNDQQPFGWFLRSLHYWSGSAMVVMVVVHMTQVFLHGAFKYPREVELVVGCRHVAADARHGIHRSGHALGCRRLLGRRCRGVDGRSSAGRRTIPGRLAPGRSDHRLRYAEPVLRAARLRHSRVLCSAMLALHLWLVLKRGISAPPVPGEMVDPATYQQEYEKDLHERGVPFFGEAMLKDALFSALTTIVVVSAGGDRRAQGAGRIARARS